MTKGDQNFHLDADRLRKSQVALESVDIVNSSPEGEFDTLVQLLSRSLDGSSAVITLGHDSDQRTKAECHGGPVRMPDQKKFCAEVLRADDLLVWNKSFAADIGRSQRAYNAYICAGIPLHIADPADNLSWSPIGALCIFDIEPRNFEKAIQLLKQCALMAEALLASRVAIRTINMMAVEKVRIQQILDRTRRHFRQAERMANIGTWRLTLEDNQTHWSEQTYAIHGLPTGDGKGLESALSFYPPLARAAVQAAVERTIKTGEPYDLETDFITAQGELRRVRSIGELEMADGVSIALVGVFQDITDQHALEKTLRQIASTDDLTGIANRNHFNNIADEKIEAAKISGAPLALILVDLDHFKSINDHGGHVAGDEILRLMATRLKAPYLNDSFAARLGGDEFVLMLSDPQILSDLPGLLARLLNDLRELWDNGKTTVQVSATIGAVWLSEEADCKAKLLHDADLALYHAKRNHRGSAMINGVDRLIMPRAYQRPDLRLIG